MEQHDLFSIVYRTGGTMKSTNPSIDFTGNTFCFVNIKSLPWSCLCAHYKTKRPSPTRVGCEHPLGCAWDQRLLHTLVGNASSAGIHSLRASPSAAGVAAVGHPCSAPRPSLSRAQDGPPSLRPRTTPWQSCGTPRFHSTHGPRFAVQLAQYHLPFLLSRRK